MKEEKEEIKESMVMVGVQQHVICMKGGVGEESYALNSKSQVNCFFFFFFLSKLILLRTVWLVTEVL